MIKTKAVEVNIQATSASFKEKLPKFLGGLVNKRARRTRTAIKTKGTKDFLPEKTIYFKLFESKIHKK
ncbi:hypothetical protein [Sphingobacterium lactis]|uniref:hypothetical protein n=1 Tax=Sphingobacterium lactis TaxID=797291 RepID=UPI003DA6B9B4